MMQQRLENKNLTDNWMKASKELIGRQNEAELLKNCFVSAVKGSGQVIMVKGESGTGKSILVYQTIRSMISDHEYFCFGKFDEKTKEEPYSAIKKALNHLIRQMLTESNESMKYTKDYLQKSFGNSNSILPYLLPTLLKIVDKNESSNEFDFNKNQRTMFQEVLQFIQFASEKRKVLVLFLDDLQWADPKSLELIGNICNNICGMQVLLIGAYREEEVNEEHPVMELVSGLSSDLKCINLIEISNFNLEMTKAYIHKYILCSEQESDSFSNLLYANTLGNPFYIDKFVRMLFDMDLIRPNEKGYTLNIGEIENVDMSEDVVQMIIKEIERFDLEVIEILKVAVMLGSSFDSAVINKYWDKWNNLQEVLGMLEEKAFIYKKPEEKTAYVFTHDKIIQAIFSMINDEEEVSIGHRIGFIYLNNTSGTYIDENILHIMSYFQKGLGHIISSNRDHHLKLAHYFLKAGEAAVLSVAHKTGLIYCQLGLQLMGEDPFEVNDQLAYKLNFKLAQCSYLVGEEQVASDIFEQLIERSKTNIEKADIYIMKTVLYSSKGLYQEAIEEGIKAAKYLGIRIPNRFIKFEILKELLYSKILFTNRKMDKLLEKPEIKSEKTLKVIEILMKISPAANIINDERFPLLLLKGANLSAKHGNSKYAIISYSAYSMVLTMVLKDYAKSKKLEDITLKLIDIYQDKNMNCSALFGMGTFVTHFSAHANECLQYFERTIKDAIDVGDYNFVSYSLSMDIETRYILGQPLKAIQKKMEEHEPNRLKVNMDEANDTFHMYRQMCEFFETTDLYEFDVDLLKKLHDKGVTDELSYYYLDCQKDYILGNYQEALAKIEKTLPLISAIEGYYVASEYYYYYGLVIGGIYDQLPLKRKKKYIKKLKWCIKKMDKLSKLCEENFLHKYYLLEGEYYRACEDYKQAITVYHLAIEDAEKNKYIQNQAIGTERLGRLYYKIADDSNGEKYLLKAYKTYENWGASRKCKLLTDRYLVLEKLLKEEKKANREDIVERGINYEGKSLELLDEISVATSLLDVLKPSLTEFMDLTKSDLGHIVIEYNNEMIIRTSSDDKAVNQDIEKYSRISKKIVRYVSRTNERVVFGVEKRSSLFMNDPYVIDDPRICILCLPLLYNGIFLGIVYLEKEDKLGGYLPEEINNLESLLKRISGNIKLKMLDGNNDNTKQENIPEFTNREIEVIKLMAEGLSNKEISEKLVISVNTTKTHLINIFGKLEVNNRIKAVMKAQKYGLL